MMDQVIAGLWIGNLKSALDTEYLKVHGIFSILSAMRGKITVNKTFIRHQIELDDTEDEDILTHFLPSIRFIQAELDKGRGVLVHCLGGVSRSATIVTAYLMYSQKLDPQAALKLVKKVRPAVDPSDNFRRQLQLFYDAQYKTSRGEKPIRMFYMSRTADEVMNGNGSPPETSMFAKYPQTPCDSQSSIPRSPRRRIRCKMCRQELATREHMLDHGQLGPATPECTSPVTSRRPSNSTPQSRARPSAIAKSPSGSDTESSHRSHTLSFAPALGKSLSTSSIEEDPDPDSSDNGEKAFSNTMPQNTSNLIPTEHPLPSLGSISEKLSKISLESTSALETEDETGESQMPYAQPLKSNLSVITTEEINASEALSRRPSDAITSSNLESKLKHDSNDACHSVANGSTISTHPSSASDVNVNIPTTHLARASDLAAQLFSNPKLAGLRSLPTNERLSSPILINPKCSGYFVEPMKWMDHFLSSGEISGKMTCPNKKCGVKLGNYDWAGVCCGCKVWVIPGFCINRSKVDEVV